MANSTLGAIRDKVRRLTRSPSQNQLSDAQLDDYVNTFMLYDFPSTLKLFDLRTTLVFYTQPNVDKYETNTTDLNHPLYNFKNRYAAVHQPCYVAGVPAFYTQDRAVYYASWPKISAVADTQLRGNNTTGPYTGTLSSNGSGVPVMQNECVFTANDALGNGLVMVDYPYSNVMGTLGVPGLATPPAPSVNNQINYLTGVFTVTFPAVVPTGGVITSETAPYQPGKPMGILFFNGMFFVRPIPDKVYAVSVEVDMRPTELLNITDVPGEAQWWQYVAIGAAMKIFQDRFDFDSVQMITPEFMRQQSMVMNKVACQYAEDRAKTIYTSGNKLGFGWFVSQWPY